MTALTTKEEGILETLCITATGLLKTIYADPLIKRLEGGTDEHRISVYRIGTNIRIDVVRIS